MLAKVFEQMASASGMSNDDAKVGVMQTQGWRNAGLSKVLTRLVVPEPFRLVLCGVETIYSVCPPGH